MNFQREQRLVIQLVVFKKMLLKENVKGEHCFCGYTGFLVDDVFFFCFIIFIIIIILSAVSPASDQTLCLIEQVWYFSLSLPTIRITST